METLICELGLSVKIIINLKLDDYEKIVILICRSVLVMHMGATASKLADRKAAAV